MLSILSATSSPTNGVRRPPAQSFIRASLCPSTGSDQLEWRVSKGLGTVYATTVVHPQERPRPYQRGALDRLSMRASA